MGTRHLTIIKDAGKIHAQYGQWDGYPSGQGVDILRFLREEIKEQVFRRNFKKAQMLSDAEVRGLLDPISDGGTDPLPGFMSMKTADMRKEAYPQLDRDMGSGVLAHIQSGNDLRYSSAIEFAADSLFCEYAYMVDFDTRSLRVFKGFNVEPLEKGQFFADMKLRGPLSDGTQYHPIKEVKRYSLDDLPSEESFLKDLKEEDE